MDQFLGALAFAKGIGRTLVLPHLVEYPERFSSSVNLTLLFRNDFYSHLKGSNTISKLF